MLSAKAPDKYAVVIGQSGLGLPDRDYYLTAQFSGKRTAYLAYIVHILNLIGWDTPKELAAAILTFETAIAEASWPLTERQDSEKIYNPIRVAKLAQIAPFPWRRFLRGADLAELDRVVLAEATAVPGLWADADCHAKSLGSISRRRCGRALSFETVCHCEFPIS
jgi:putative endopeptidase